MFVEAHFQYKACKSLVRPQVEYCFSVWDSAPTQALRIPVHITSKGYSTTQLDGACADTTTQLASPTSLKIKDGVPQSNVGLTAGSQPSLRSHGSSSLLTLTGFCALSWAENVASIRKVSSRLKLACPLGSYPFFQEHLFSGRVYLLPSLANNVL